MKILISGICGFVGSTLARAFLEQRPGLSLSGCDNFSRPGSHTNISGLKQLGVRLHHADVRAASDFEGLAAADWLIDCSANPSVLAGTAGQMGSRQLVEHNLGGTLNLLEYCRQHQAGFILLSTSRVYSIPPLARLPVIERSQGYCIDPQGELPGGVSPAGVSELFSTAAPISLYGATKLASETMALEYGASFSLPVFVNRCGVLAGAGQFGRADQGIFSYWVHSWARRRALKYIGFGGNGYQVRDCLHPADLAPLLLRQMAASAPPASRVINVGGGASSACSLRQLSDWCADRFGPHEVVPDLQPRLFDIPWLVLDSGLAACQWNWRPSRPLMSILDEIAEHADRHEDWLELSAPL